MKKLLVTLVVMFAVASMSGTAYADDLKFEAELTGAAERPTPVVTDGEGDAKFESDGSSVTFELTWKDLKASAFASHIHCGGPEVAGPVGVTLFTGSMGTEGEVQGTFTAPDAGNGCGWVDLADVLGAMATGNTYVNIHTSAHPGGEIRGQIAID